MADLFEAATHGYFWGGLLVGLILGSFLTVRHYEADQRKKGDATPREPN